MYFDCLFFYEIIYSFWIEFGYDNQVGKIGVFIDLNYLWLNWLWVY